MGTRMTSGILKEEKKRVKPFMRETKTIRERLVKWYAWSWWLSFVGFEVLMQNEEEGRLKAVDTGYIGRYCFMFATGLKIPLQFS